MLPKTEINGNAVADWQEGVTNNGTGYINGRVACNKNRRNQSDGSWETVAAFFVNVTWWNPPQGVTLRRKGDRVQTYGELSTQQFEDKTGAHRTSSQLTAAFVRTFPKQDKPKPQGGWEQQGRAAQQSAWNAQPDDDEPPF